MGGTLSCQADYTVVGAGLAGLRAAVDLSAAGAAVTVFEARDRVGGRVLSAPDARRGHSPLVLDLGAQWVAPGQSEVLRLVKELGLQLMPTAVPGKAIWQLDGHLTRGRAAFPPLPPHAVADVVANAARIAWMARSIAPEAPWRASKAGIWDRLTCEDWIRRHLRTRSGRELARMYVRNDVAIEPSETSLLGLLFDLRSVGRMRDLVSAEAYRLREGAHELARRLAVRLGDRIRFADPVRAITQDADAVTVESDACTVRCRRAVVCVPPALASRISYTPVLPDQRARLLATLPMGASVKFHAVYRHPFWRAQGLSGQALTAEGTVGLTYDNSPEDGSGRGVLVGLVVANEARRLGGLGRDRQEQEILAALGRLFGPDAAAPDRLVIQDWGAEEWTGGCYAAYFPMGALTSDGPALRAPTGRIHWAGTETASHWHGYMEGALGSARRAVAEMLRAESGQEVAASSDGQPDSGR